MTEKIVEEIEEIVEEKGKKGKPIKDINGANVKDMNIDLGKKGKKRPVLDVTLDMEKEEVLELIEKTDGFVEFRFVAHHIPGFFKEIVDELSFDSKRNYFLEVAAEDAEKRKQAQEDDDEYIGDLIKVLSEPHFSGRFKNGIDERELREKDLVVAHVRPDEVDRMETLGYKSIGTVEGTPVVPPDSRSKFQGDNMIRMVVPRKRKEAIENHYQKTSKEKIGSMGFDGKPEEEIHYRVKKPEYTEK